MRTATNQHLNSDTQRFLSLDPSERSALVVLTEDELLAAAGKGGAAGKAAAPAGGAAAGAAAAVVALAPYVVGTATLVGLGVKLMLDQKKGPPEGLQLIDPKTAQGLLSSNGRPLQRGLLYNIHPVRTDVYLPYGRYYKDLLGERAREAEAFFLHCGASRIELTVEYGSEINLSGGITYEEPRFSIRGRTKARRTQSSTRASVIEARGYRRPRKFRSEDWIWANVEDEWLALYENRREHGIRSAELSTIMEEDRALTVDVAAKVPKIAKIDLGGSAEKFEKTKWTWHVSFPD